ARQRSPAGDLCRIDAFQPLGIGGRLHGLPQHAGQPREQVGVAAGGIAGFQGVIMLGHGKLRPIADRRWRGIKRVSAAPGVVSGKAMGDPSAAADAGDIVAQLKSFIIERSLPLWSGEGWDRSTGGFVDRLDPEGRADRTAPRRTFVQARQIYCFAKAAQMGWYPEGKEIALKGLDHLLSKAKAPDGAPGFVHRLDADGAVLDARRDTYDHAFVLLALATVYSLDRDAQVRSEIDAALSFVDSRLRSPHGGFAEGFPATLPRRQNPHMHLFEAMIACFDATHDLSFQNRAGEFFAL
ncbi:hypothetical protein KXV85_000450, partial [Aspergillus fumigatus]